MVLDKVMIEKGLRKLKENYENEDKYNYRLIYCLKPDEHREHWVDFKATFSRDGTIICPICLSIAI